MKTGESTGGKNDASLKNQNTMRNTSIEQPRQSESTLRKKITERRNTRKRIEMIIINMLGVLERFSVVFSILFIL